MRGEVARTVTLVLDEDDAAAVHEYLVRVHRLTDGARNCPLPSAVCAAGEELRDVVGGAIGKGHGEVPVRDVETWAQSLRWMDRELPEHDKPRCNAGYVIAGPGSVRLYCTRAQGHDGMHGGEIVWPRS